MCQWIMPILKLEIIPNHHRYYTYLWLKCREFVFKRLTNQVLGGCVGLIETF